MIIETNEKELMLKAKEQRARNFAHSGIMVSDKCPKCGSLLMRNWLGNEWCCSFDCDYFIRDSKLITEKYIRQLNLKYSKSE